MSELPFNWSKLQSPDEMDVGRHFEYDSYAAEMFKRWLPELPEDGKILEVGSGSGYFTSKLRFLYCNCTITCLEPDSVLRASLAIKFPSIEILGSPLETADITPEYYDMAISHIVIHNLPDPVAGIEQMSKAVKPGGFVVCIEPTAGYRHILPHYTLTKAFDVLNEYSRIMSIERSRLIKSRDGRNPFSYSYPEFFESLGLRNITCYGWCSVFTLSDQRFDFEHRRKWISKRKRLFIEERHEKTEVMVDAGISKEKIDDAYATILAYFDQIENADEEELSHVHEQVIINRTITIGMKV